MARVRRVTLNTVVIPLPAASLPPNPPTLSPATRVFTEDYYLNTIDTILDQGNISTPDIASFDDRGGNYSGACDGVVVAEVTNKAFNRINFTLETLFSINKTPLGTNLSEPRKRLSINYTLRLVRIRQNYTPRVIRIRNPTEFKCFWKAWRLFCFSRTLSGTFHHRW